MKLSQKEIQLVHRAADLIQNGTNFSCHALADVQNISRCEYENNELCRKYATFFGIESWVWDAWSPLPRRGADNNEQTQIQRQLMLELFAHLKGVP